MKNKTKLLAGILALTVVTGVIAYFSKTMSIDNPFSTKKYGGETVEKFTPELNWEPGGVVTKEVQAKNTGDYDLYVRVKFDEKWEREGVLIEGTSLSSSALNQFFPVSADASVKPDNKGGSAVYKHLSGVNDSTWEKGTDGYFYYKTILKPNEMTTQLMDSVTLCKDADMGTYEPSAMMYAVVDATTPADQVPDDAYKPEKPSVVNPGQVVYQKKVVTLNQNKAGLAGANYTLTITTELLQANADAAAQNGWTYTPTN